MSKSQPPSITNNNETELLRAEHSVPFYFCGQPAVLLCGGRVMGEGHGGGLMGRRVMGGFMGRSVKVFVDCSDDQFSLTWVKNGME